MFAYGLNVLSLFLQGACYVTPEGYGHMTHMLNSLAGGRVISILEVRSKVNKTHECIVVF